MATPNLDGTPRTPPPTVPGVTTGGAPPRTLQRTSAAPVQTGTMRPLAATASLDAPIVSAAPAGADRARVQLPYIPESRGTARPSAGARNPFGSLSSRAALQQQADQRAAFPTDNAADPRVEHPLSLKDNPLDGRPEAHAAVAAPPAPETAPSAEPPRIAMEQVSGAPGFSVPGGFAAMEGDALGGLLDRLDAIELRLEALEEREDSPAEEESPPEEDSPPEEEAPSEEEAPPEPETEET